MVLLYSSNMEIKLNPSEFHRHVFSKLPTYCKERGLFQSLFSPCWNSKLNLPVHWTRLEQHWLLGFSTLLKDQPLAYKISIYKEIICFQLFYKWIFNWLSMFLFELRFNAIKMILCFLQSLTTTKVQTWFFFLEKKTLRVARTWRLCGSDEPTKLEIRSLVLAQTLNTSQTILASKSYISRPTNCFQNINLQRNHLLSAILQMNLHLIIHVFVRTSI